MGVGGLEAGLGVDTNSSSPRPLLKEPVIWTRHNVELSSCIKLIYIMKTFAPCVVCVCVFGDQRKVK